MVVGRALRATRCVSCRLSLLRSFTSLAGPPIQAPRISARLPSHRAPNQRFRRSSQLVQGNQEPKTGDVETLRPETTEGDALEREERAEEVDEVAEEAEASSIPWYLRVESPQIQTRPLSERQRIPELPNDPPPMLQALLQQISVDLGMDDLKILDLRNLDPPPALGANLLMVIGTARSEKHLHVSADRLCRWLRSEYELRPDADGLLGRNELKLKMKRKAKRAKLMGANDDANADDGVRTGWVCVDAGIVEGGTTSEAVPRRKFVGFGRRNDGVRIVVQMLTEEKREEIDLERLWGGIITRGGQSEMDGSDYGHDYPEEDIPLPRPLAGATERSLFRTSSHGQRRELHTSPRRPLEPISSYHQRALPEKFDIEGFGNAVTEEVYFGNFADVPTNLIQLGKRLPKLQNENWRLFLLKIMQKDLECSKEEGQNL